MTRFKKAHIDSAGIPHRKGGITPALLPAISSNGIKRQVGGLINNTGYLRGAKTNRNPVNVIPSRHITTDNMIGPIMANGRLLMPDTGDYLFPEPYVVEHRLRRGGRFQSRWGGKTITTPQYLTTYPNTESMRKSLRGRMATGGRHYDPQLGNYKSNIYQGGGNANTNNIHAFSDDVTNPRMRFMDFVNNAIGSGSPMPLTTPRGRQFASSNPGFTSDPYMRDVLSAVSIYNQRPDLQGVSPNDRVSRFYNLSGGNPNVERYRNSNRALMNQNAFYTNSADMGDRAQMAAAYMWGGVTDRFATPETEEIRDDWKDVMYNNPDYKKGGKHWIQGAINPAHKGYCTPMSKPTCTGRRRALALLFKRKHGFHKKAMGGYDDGGNVQDFLQMMMGGPAGIDPRYNFQVGGLTSFTPAGSLVDQNQWAMLGANPNTPTYRKSDNSIQTGLKQVNSFGTPNLNNLGWLLPANAVLGAAGQANQYHQNQQWRQNNLNNPLSTLAYDDGRPQDVRYGYQFQQGGNTAASTRYTIPEPQLYRDHQGTILQPSYEFMGPGTKADSSDYRAGFYNTLQREKSGALHSRQSPVFRYDPRFIPGDNWNDDKLYQPGHNPAFNKGVSEAYMNAQMQYGGVNGQPGNPREGMIRFAGRPLKLWQRGGMKGIDTGAATRLHPYMLYNGRFQDGGNLMDQWDYEDMMDQQGSPVSGYPQGQDTFEPDNLDYRRKIDLSDDEDYQNALMIANDDLPGYMSQSYNNPYFD